MKRIFACFVLILTMMAIPGVARSQDEPILSPPEKTACKFADGKTITVNYSSPRIRDRVIYGGLVPYGEVWRAGANEATTFVTKAGVVVGGKDVPAGAYTLFTFPTKDKWSLIISKKTGEWGIPYPGEQFDFARIPMTISKLPSLLQNFTISFDATGTVCKMKLDWEMTRVSIDVVEKK